MSEPVLQVAALSLAFGLVRALDQIALDVHGGEILSLIGPNGAGKSSLLNCLSGFYRPQSGKIRFRGRDITRAAPHRRARAGMARTFQGLQTYDRMTVRENVLSGFHTSMRCGLAAAFLYWPFGAREEAAFSEKAEQIIEFLELEELRHTQVGSLSYGLRKRVDLGRALALQPELLLMDEPMAGMNLEEKGDLARFILDIREARKIPIVLVEHDMEVVMDISDRVAVMEWGRLIAEGSPEKIRRDPRVIAAYLGQA
jgi:branched-chain amino acid transport system ATP-binding protein